DALPVYRVSERTPDNVLGFLAWFLEDDEAKRLLFARRGLLHAPTNPRQEPRNRREARFLAQRDEAHADRAFELASMLRDWDFLNPPQAAALQQTGVRNTVITRYRKDRRGPRLEDAEAVGDPRPQTVPEEEGGAAEAEAEISPDARFIEQV